MNNHLGVVKDIIEHNHSVNVFTIGIGMLAFQ